MADMAPRMQMILQPRLELQMKLAPQIIQSIEILQLTTLALEQRIDQERLENPVLELLEEVPEDSETPEQDTDTKEDENFEKLCELAEADWQDYYNLTAVRKKGSLERDKKLDAMQNTAARPQSLQDYLAAQLGLLELPTTIARIAEAIIYNLDDDGYLLGLLEEVVKGMDDDEITIEQAEEALRIVQSLDPIGVGARDIKECLLTQLSSNGRQNTLAKELIADYFEDIKKNRFPMIAKKTGRSIETIRKAVKLIGTLNPKPGSQFGGESVPYIIPDIIVQYVNGIYEIALSDTSTPRLCISNFYRRMLREKKCSPQAKEYIKKKIESAKWLMDSIEQRRSTLHKVASEIVKTQEAFLDQGISHLKPLKMQQVADATQMHVATVSRAVAGKWMQTPRGLFEMKFFFSGGTSNAEGNDEAWRSVRHKVRELINHEDSLKPLSDEEIATRLQAEGLNVARRTVTKWRRGMGILSSRQRRQY